MYNSKLKPLDRRVPACILALTFLLLPAVGNSEVAEYGFLVIAASVTNEDEQQPTFIAFSRDDAITHVPASRTVAILPAGRYQIVHIDFNEGENQETGVQKLVGRPPIEIRAGKIYLVGEFQFKKKGKKKYKASMGDSHALLARACQKYPEMFEQYPLTSFDHQKEMMVSCQGMLEVN